MSGTKVSLSFFGAAGTVTGSKHLLTVNDRKVLLDAGLFQGLKDLRLRNWSAPPFDPSQIHAVILSHAHIDHSGYLPLLARKGFRGKIYCTPGTADLANILLRDAAHLQEEEAEFANRKGYSKHKPALPLYTVRDAESALARIETHVFGKPFSVCPSTPLGTSERVTAIFRRAGHILGAATIEIQIEQGNNLKHTLVFSGDLGRWHQPILQDPEMIQEADTLLIEATYGNRVHPENTAESLAEIVNGSIKKGGVLVIPSFAVGRAQELVWRLSHLEKEGKIPVVPVYVDSPMAVRANRIYVSHSEEHDAEMDKTREKSINPLATRNFGRVSAIEESKRLNTISGPAIIISSSGMATGGRVLHHLKRRLPDTQNTVLLVGYQAVGTRGRSLQEGKKTIRMFGEEVPVRAKVEMLEGLSAHADRDDILRWLKGFKRLPRQTFIVHGEPESLEALAGTIRTELGWNARPALDGETVTLSL